MMFLDDFVGWFNLWNPFGFGIWNNIYSRLRKRLLFPKHTEYVPVFSPLPMSHVFAQQREDPATFIMEIGTSTDVTQSIFEAKDTSRKLS